ncbi:MAG: bifunctional DNA-formamidopyrimidine glycosylase/DNA-(apurinic or apyrimidinic site) lyase [Gemmatimonadota bacterium]
MPELPETETIATDLGERIVGRSVIGVRVTRADVLRRTTARRLSSALSDREVGSVWRRSKTVVIDFARGDVLHLLVTPRFTGALLISRAPPSDPYSAVEFALSGDLWLRYRDVRRLGTVELCDDAGLHSFSARLGPEPLSPDFTKEVLSGILRASNRPVKSIVMDPARLAGIGNIYANEALWMAGIDPSRPGASVSAGEAGRLHLALVDVLRRAIAARGTTFRDYRDPSNDVGGFARQLVAYGRGGAPCLRCGSRLAETHAIDGRSTVFCFRCQR